MDSAEVPAGTPLLTVKTLTDRRITVQLLDGISTIGDVKKVLVDKEGADVASHPLLYKGTVLADNVKLADLFDLNETFEDKGKDTQQGHAVHLFYYEPSALQADPIDIATDWDAKNRLKVFKGMYLLAKRDFYSAADLLCDCLATFQETSFIDFNQLIKYAVLAGTLAFDRPVLKQRILKSPEVLESLSQLGALEGLVSSLYNCQYAAFFTHLAAIEQDWLGKDWVLEGHRAFIVKELRVKAYQQLLMAYRSVKLSLMAEAFGVSEAFLEDELVRFIAAGRLSCSIDKVAGVVNTVPVNRKQIQYDLLMREGEELFDRVQRLTRMVSY